jgi:hypothetical protein
MSGAAEVALPIVRGHQCKIPESFGSVSPFTRRIHAIAATMTGEDHIDGPFRGDHCAAALMLFFRQPCAPILRSAGASRLWQ